MAIAKIYSVYDAKTETFNRPFFFLTNGEALRSWSDTVNDDKTIFYKHPEDYTLFELGSFDDNNGVVTMLTSPKSLGLAQEYRRSDMPPSSR